MKLHRNKDNKLPFLFLIILLVGVSTGCSVSPPASEMITENLSVVNHYPHSISLDVKGDEDDIWTKGELLRAVDLEEAIEASISRSGIFNKVIRGSGADYQLKVDANVNAPAAGFSMTVTVGGNWQLVNLASKKVLMDEFVSTSHTATVGDAFAGPTRFKLALREAARKFVEEGMRRLDSVPRI